MGPDFHQAPLPLCRLLLPLCRLLLPLCLCASVPFAPASVPAYEIDAENK